MNQAATHKKPSRSSGRERRQLILEATLRLIAREGVRAVRHRPVAAEANVPLAATTYYFKDINELISESFRYWSGSKDIYLDEFRDQLTDVLATFASADDPVSRASGAAMIRDFTVAYVVKQARMIDDRIIELAFKHEALGSESLRELVLEQDQRFVDSVYLLMEAIGSKQPESDAEITLSTILRLEQQAVIRGVDEEKIHRVITRHLQHLLEVDIE